MFDNLLRLSASLFLLGGASFLFYQVANLIRDDIRLRRRK